MIDTTINLGHILTMIAMAIAAMSAFFFQRYQVNSAKADASAALIIAESTGKDLNDFKLTVAEKYIRGEHLEKVEERLIASESRMTATIEGLVKRVDALIDRMDRAR